MKNKRHFSRNNFVAVLIFLMVSDCLVMAQSPAIPPPNFKVAFIGGQGKGENGRAVLHLIKTEGAQAVIHQGDLDYDHNPPNWDKMISDSLGVNFPYFVSAGDADVNPWEGPTGYQAMVENRLRRTGITWNGDLGVNSSLNYNGLFIILSGVDVFGAGHSTYIRDQLAGDNSIWRICSWHKNMRLMQVAGKKDETGWGVYEESRLGGAIIATGHSHTYSRSHLLSSMQNQTVASTANELHIEKGKTFVFVHEIGGHGTSSQELSGNWWASIYTRTQGAKYGALFGVFHVDGQPNKARFYMKNIAGQTIDTFTVISHVNENVSPSVTVTAPNGGETWEIDATRHLTWNSSYFSNPMALDYSLNGGVSWTAIASGVANNGSYAWNIAASPSTQARVRVADASDGDPIDASDNNFTLTNIPLTPANLVATAASINSINLNWSDNSGIESGFVIERKTGVGETYSQIAVTGVNVTSYADNGLAESTTYYYRVRATNAAGDSPHSNEASATTPGAPTGNLALNKPATASSTNGSFVPGRAVDGGATSSSYWRSANVGKTTPNTWLRVDLGSAFSLMRAVVKWKENYFAKQYRFQISNSDGNTDGEWITVYTNNSGAAGTQNVTFTSPFAARYFRIQIDRNNKDNNQVYELECYAGASATPKLEAGILNPVSSDPTEQLEFLHISPNPFNPSTVINYSVMEALHVTLKIYNLAGQEVAILVDGYLERGRHQAVFFGAHLPSGIYFAVLQAGTERRMQRLLLMK